MLEGWYCRTLANEQSSVNQDERMEGTIEVNEDSGSEESQDVANDNANNSIDFKSQYRYLKRKFKFLIYVSIIVLSIELI